MEESLGTGEASVPMSSPDAIPDSGPLRPSSTSVVTFNGVITRITSTVLLLDKSLLTDEKSKADVDGSSCNFRILLI